MIRPQTKKAKLAKQFQENMQKGDRIVTIAGIHGKVNKVNEDGTLEIETSPGSYLKIEKTAISMEWTQNINKPVTAEKKA
jgi:preprotein translocase subunit YajC